MIGRAYLGRETAFTLKEGIGDDGEPKNERRSVRKGRKDVSIPGLPW